MTYRVTLQHTGGHIEETDALSERAALELARQARKAGVPVVVVRYPSGRALAWMQPLLLPV
jgi:hypothetical protein